MHQAYGEDPVFKTIKKFKRSFEFKNNSATRIPQRSHSDEIFVLSILLEKENSDDKTRKLSCNISVEESHFKHEKVSFLSYRLFSLRLN